VAELDVVCLLAAQRRPQKRHVVGVIFDEKQFHGAREPATPGRTESNAPEAYRQLIAAPCDTFHILRVSIRAGPFPVW
jgi:hypothetical protein